MNSKTLIRLTATALEFSREGIDGALKFEIGDLVKNQEVADVRLLDKKLKEFLDASGMVKGEVSLVLSPEMTFQKIIPLTDAKDEKFETEKFLADIPFEPPNIEVRSKKNETDLSLFAGNKHLFYPIVRILEKYGWTVLIVSPEGVEVNFLSSLEETSGSEKFFTNISSKIILLTTIFLLLLLSLGLFLLFNQNKPKSIPAEVPFAASPSGLPIPVKIPFKQKQDLKIQVLNGSGKEGDAGKVVTALQKLGYKNLETGNLDVQNVTVTLVNLNNNLIPPEIYPEINTVLAKLFSRIASSSASVSTLFDIVITTGK